MRDLVLDEQGTPLDVLEIRERLAAGLPLRINDDVDMIHERWIPRSLRKALYRGCLSKDCFRYDCPLHSEPNYEPCQRGRTYIEVNPEGYRTDWLAKPRATLRGNTSVCTSDAAGFWASPWQALETPVHAAEDKAERLRPRWSS